MTVKIVLRRILFVKDLYAVLECGAVCLSKTKSDYENQTDGFLGKFKRADCFRKQGTVVPQCEKEAGSFDPVSFGLLGRFPNPLCLCIERCS